MEFRRILVPVDGDSADEEAIGLACDFSSRSSGHIYVLYVIEVPWKLPIDADMELEVRKAEAVLDYMESIAKKSHTRVETEVLQARSVGTAVVEEAIARRIDLIVMNTAYERRYGEFYLGEGAPYVLKNAPCHVWLYRGPMNGSR
ncbi:MAG: universal stress protein [Dehalococcoidia bacterium]